MKKIQKKQEPVDTESTITTAQCVIKGFELLEEGIVYVFDESGTRTIHAKIEEDLILENLISLDSKVEIELIENTMRNKNTGDFIGKNYYVTSISLVV